MIRAAFPVLVSLCLANLPVPPQDPAPSGHFMLQSGAGTRLESRQSNIVPEARNPARQAIIRLGGVVYMVDGNRLDRRVDHRGNPNLILQLP
jgi:hypothetical protein